MRNLILRNLILLLAALVWLPAMARAQGNYEVQVYGSDLVPPNVTMAELHSNFTAEGERRTINGVLPTNHAEHETLEIAHGFDQWFELGFYQFTSIQPGGGWDWVGTHLRPRIAIPDSYGLPVGLSLSMEVGYQRPSFSGDTWTWEIRPIVDKKLGKWYLCANPVLARSFHGPSVPGGLDFSPNLKFSYDVTKRVAAGVEYYGDYGPLTGFVPLREQQQNIVPALDIDFGDKWEFNFGVGMGVTAATDHLLIKAILGYRFNYTKQ